MHPGVGFRIRKTTDRLDRAVVAEFAEYETPEISDMLNRLYAVDSAITRLSGHGRMLAGSATTVRVFPGDNLMVHKSLDIAEPGDVVVVAAGGSFSNAVLGDTISAKAKHRGIAGFVIDGVVRDVAGLRELDFPVWARGATSVGPLHRGPGEINYSIACGGVVVNPGDVIVGDDSGLVVVPKETAGELLVRLRGFKAGAAGYLAAVDRGEFDNRWADQILTNLNCEVTP
ncbi:RraA family protein [Pseudonocardia eucalypti]|uniref:Putative 4-hydroxy-4-methyl-2-oxoglutarate aldolase n=1 Tax=Pseudonocardia eucalypti TaxID=648755 RepID=A0ABP9QAJ6_9PSEU